MLVFSALTPHPPLLIPTIGKEKTEQLTKTLAAFNNLEEELYLSKPQVIMIISPHGVNLQKSLAINIHPQLIASFEEFGDLATKQQFTGLPSMSTAITRKQTTDLPIKIISEKKLGHGVSIPLYFLTRHLTNVSIVPIYPGQNTPLERLHFGEILKKVIMESDKRIAVIASGDLSHALVTDSPAGFHPDGAKFDQTLIEYLETRNTLGIAQIDPEMVINAAQCVYNPLLILLGIMKNINYTFKNLAYEAPFGVGYLTGHFVF